MKKIVNQLLAKWFACRITSGKKSVQYGIRFSYPMYISLVALGILLVNPYILVLTAFIAFLGVVLPMHPFDYVYNFAIAKLLGTEKILGRGTEMQVSSTVALIFNLAAIALIVFEVRFNSGILALIYAISSMFFVAIFLFRGK